ncbi:hypothetical protein VTL71DRAFT_2966 [Oculimacula yallundae]|uniref:Uncharacterized protein n=1 Tax=Oculimacula yallundae TaxID=86028 RepID=A0ABR4C711_9HELO
MSATLASTCLASFYLTRPRAFHDKYIAYKKHPSVQFNFISKTTTSVADIVVKAFERAHYETELQKSRILILLRKQSTRASTCSVHRVESTGSTSENQREDPSNKKEAEAIILACVTDLQARAIPQVQT